MENVDVCNRSVGLAICFVIGIQAYLCGGSVRKIKRLVDQVVGFRELPNDIKLWVNFI